ncbi:MAG: EscU/YscU/HrcU family type III secretion system export apparatus switch protein [Acidobacteria bacterium]|nr:EscU/YscU/HrcU family type III secretion system export apparatus switch protein [Acidobacteriota bacterium]
MASDRTEQPTQRRQDKARKEGNFPVSKEFVSAVHFIVVVWLLNAYGEQWFRASGVSFRRALTAGFRTDLTPADVQQILWKLITDNVLSLLLAGSALMVATVAAQVFTTNLGISLNKIAPDLKRLNPASKLKQLPGQNFPQLIQAVVLLPLFGIAIWAIVWENLQAFSTLPLTGLVSGAAKVGSSVMALMWRAAMLFLIVGLVDLFRQRRRHQSQLKMTKQEIRDEVKESEGNPQTKQRIRRIQRDVIRRSMMKEVPKATAIIVNPTHYAVAIRYSMETQAAPKVVAKGKNYLARRIREIAMEHNVPIVENQPLAQALYKSVEVGQEIPAHLYRAVAEILAYLYRLMNGRLPG